MQFFALTAAALLAVASAASCDLAKLAPVVTGGNGAKCTADSGVSFLPPSVPTSAQLPKLCNSANCRAFLADLKAAAPTECTVDISTPKLELYAQLLTPIEKACGPAAAPAPAPAAGPAPAPAPAAGPAPAPAPAGQTAPTPAPTKDDSC